MPKMDGIEAVKIIRSLGFVNPVVALTANAVSGQSEMFLANGFDGFISKPIDIRQLDASLNKFIRDKQTPDVLEDARRQKSALSGSRHRIAVEPQLAEVFVRDAERAVDIFNLVINNGFQNADDADDFSTFIINIHAMKSALANIGETELSGEAAKLEQAGREKNAQLILSALPEFTDSLQILIDRLKPDETGAEGEIITISGADEQYLREKMLEIFDACTNLNKKAAKDALTEIKKKTWTKPVRDKLGTISEQLLHSEFSEAAAAAKEILEKNY